MGQGLTSVCLIKKLCRNCKLNINKAANMGNKAGKNKDTDEDMEFLMSHVEDKSLGGKSAFYRLNFEDSGHTKERIREWQEGKENDLNKNQFLSMVTEFGIMGTPKNFEALSDESPEAKIRWAFKTYDENKDGFIDAEEAKRYVATVCEMMKRECDGEALAEAVMKKLDANQDGKVSHEEAMSACATDDELLNLLNLSVNKHFHY